MFQFFVTEHSGAKCSAWRRLAEPAESPPSSSPLGGWDCETVRGCRSYWYVRLQKQLLFPPPRRLGLWEGVDHTDHTDEIVSILRWWKWTRQEQCWHISVVNEHGHLHPTYMKTLYSIPPHFLNSSLWFCPCPCPCPGVCPCPGICLCPCPGVCPCPVPRAWHCHLLLLVLLIQISSISKSDQVQIVDLLRWVRKALNVRTWMSPWPERTAMALGPTGSFS